MKKNTVFCLVFAAAASVFSMQEGDSGIRRPARAGQFYPGTVQELLETVDNLLTRNTTFLENDVAGIWVPHDGYEFSGLIAANAWAVMQGRSYDVVILVGASHYVALKGASLGHYSAYRTPLGDVPVDTALAAEIMEASRMIRFVPEAHRFEHSLEVQLPFLQRVLPGVPIVPVLVGRLDLGQAREVAEAIVRSLGNRRALFVASSDMSHYPAYRDAYEVDLRMLDAVKTLDPRDVLRTEAAIMKENIPNLECVLCGMPAVITVMEAVKKQNAEKVHILPYANSGDVSGERHRVVGYGAALFLRPLPETKSGRTRSGQQEGVLSMDEIPFTPDEKKTLFGMARESILCALKRTDLPDFSTDSPHLNARRGVFVTLMNGGQLRGCIGHFGAEYPLAEIVPRMAVAAATQDYRFMANPVTPAEMDRIHIKISILSEMKKVASVEEIEVGKHGIWIRQGNRGGTYLPEVAVEMGWDREAFLTHCCAEKAGLAPDAWKNDADIYIYSSQILSEADL